MENKIKELIDKYSHRVEKEIIGCGLSVYNREDLKKEVNDELELLFNKVVGIRPDTGTNSPEYTDWYKRYLVFNQIFRSIEGKWLNGHEYYNTPAELQNHYGPRD